jgi:hypothetical protein
MKPRNHVKPTKRLARYFAPGREFATAKELADSLREAELVRIHQWGI